MQKCWGAELTDGESIKVSPGDGQVFCLTQASLGVQSNKGKENVNLFVDIDGIKSVLGTLITNKLPQHQFNIFFDQEIELSHNWKCGSVYFYGYKTGKSFGEELLIFGESGKTNPKANQQKPADAERANASNEKESDASRDLLKIAETCRGLDTQEDEDTTFEDIMSGDDDDKDDCQVVTSKKRPLESVEFATATPTPVKKAKGPEGTDDNKAAPFLGNKANKAPRALTKIPCKMCRRFFASESGLAEHTKAKHPVAVQS